MKRPPLRVVLTSVILVGTIAGFIWYLHTHPAYIAQLKNTQIRWLLGIFAMNCLGILTLTGLYQVLVQMTGKKLEPVENFALTAYSSIVNFFGPLQSGPGVRAGYLKTHHHVSLKAYFIVTMLYYGFFAVLSAFCLVIGTRPWWQAVFASLAVTVTSYFVIRWVLARRRAERALLVLSPRLLGWLLGLTAVQIALLCGRYFFALRAAGSHASIGQVVSYTGAANFALFVSITPDGVGIREAFLFFAQRIHHVTTATIVGANVVDRASYVAFLGVLFIVTLGLHAKTRFNARTKANQSEG